MREANKFRENPSRVHLKLIKMCSREPRIDQNVLKGAKACQLLTKTERFGRQCGIRIAERGTRKCLERPKMTARMGHQKSLDFLTELGSESCGTERPKHGISVGFSNRTALSPAVKKHRNSM